MKKTTIMTSTASDDLTTQARFSIDGRTSSIKDAFCLIEGRELADHEARAIVKGIEHLRDTFAPFVAASPDIVPNYASVPYRPKGGRQSYQITPCPDRAGFYIVAIERHDKNHYGMPIYQPDTVTVWVHVEPLHTPK